MFLDARGLVAGIKAYELTIVGNIFLSIRTDRLLIYRLIFPNDDVV